MSLDSHFSDLNSAVSSQTSHSKPPGNTHNRWPNQRYNWFFTWFNTEKASPSQISQLLKLFCKKFTFQLEECSTTKRKHYQGTFSLNTKEYFNTVLNLFGDKSGIHLEGTKDVFAANEYCSKTNTKLAGPWTEKSTFVIDYFLAFTPFPWQLEIYNLLTIPAEPRIIHWYWSIGGNLGKSTFCRHLLISREDTIVVDGKTKDINYQIKNFIDNGNNLHCILFDYSKECSNPLYYHYNEFEKLKNGFLVSGKFKSGHVIFNIPHIICFSNSPPNESRMTQNRFIITQLDSPTEELPQN